MTEKQPTPEQLLAASPFLLALGWVIYWLLSIVFNIVTSAKITFPPKPAAAHTTAEFAQYHGGADNADRPIRHKERPSGLASRHGIPLCFIGSLGGFQFLDFR